MACTETQWGKKRPANINSFERDNSYKPDDFTFKASHLNRALRFV